MQLKQINESYKVELEKLYELMNDRKAETESLEKKVFIIFSRI